MKDGELPVLPLSVYGAVVMAHNPDSEEYSSPNQFFFYLYDKRNVSSMNFIKFLIYLFVKQNQIKLLYVGRLALEGYPSTKANFLFLGTHL